MSSPFITNSSNPSSGNSAPWIRSSVRGCGEIIAAILDVSDKTTHVCVASADGLVLKRDVVASDPDLLAKWLGKHCSELERVVLERAPLSTFLYHGLAERNVPAECICAQHA